MRKIVVACLLWLLPLLLSAPPALAGGNWIEMRRSLRIGSEVTARAVFFTRAQEKVVRQGPYFAYLAPRRMRWGLPDPSHPATIRLGSVEVLWPEDHDFRGMARNNPRARITFEVPDIAVGQYVIAFCNEPCTVPLGDVDPTGWFWVVHTATEGKLFQRVEALKMAEREVKYRLGIVRRGAFEARFDLRTTESELADARGRVAALESRIARLRDERSDLVWPLWAGLAGASGAALTFLLRARMRRRRRFDAELARLLDEGLRSRETARSPSL